MFIHNATNTTKINSNIYIKSFTFNNNNKNWLLNNNTIRIINSYFESLNSINNKYICSNPTYNITNDTITIEVMYYNINTDTKSIMFKDNSIISININSKILLAQKISYIYKIKVNLEFKRVYYPYINSIIFAKYLSYNSNQNNYLHFQDSIQINISIMKNKLPSHITGIKIIISGRIITEPVVPRVTKKSFSYGSFKGKNIFIDYNAYTTKNRLGTFTFKVWICQQF